MNIYPFSFSHLQKALLAVGSFSCLGLSSIAAHAEAENDIQQLETIKLTAQASQSAYYAPSVNLSGFTQQNLAEIPASINTITATQIADQHAKTLTDIVKNDAAVGDGYAPIGYYSNFIMRGFALNAGSSYLLNGNLVRGEQNIALENKEQVEILKGISAIQSGMSTPAGVVNYVTKRPKDVRALTLETDSQGGYRVATDLGGLFGQNQQFGYRVNIAKEEIHPYVEHANGQRLFSSIAFDWNLSDRSKLEFDIESQRQRQRSVPGYQLLDGKTVPTGVEWDRLLGHQSWGKPVTNESLNANLKYLYKINDSWTANLSASQSRVVVDDYSAFPWGCYSDICEFTGLGNTFDKNGNYDIYDFRSPDDSYLTNQFKAGLNGKFNTGTVQHTLSLDLTNSYKRHAQHDPINELVGTGNIYTNTVNYSPTDVALGNRYKSLDSQQTALNLLDQIDFNREWSMLVGGKLLHLNEKAFDAEGSTIRDTDLNRFLPQFAVMYQPWEHTHLYASYAKGLSDGAQAPWFANNAYATLAPLRSKQFELGVKQEWQSLLFTAALFDLRQDHQYTNTMGDFVSEGKQNNLGLELGLQGRVGQNLDISSTLALTRSRLKDLDVITYQGHQTQNVPKVRFATHLSYQVPQFEGLRLLAGMRYSSSKYANKTGTVKVSGYSVFDAGAAYNFNAYGYENTLRLNVDNLFNKKYWRDAGSFFGDDYLFLGAPRTAQLSWTVNF
ncbi:MULTISPECIES: TonB-dependent siderophore receptor [Acinetobacter]|uniref:TonB-dependent siderophore receptor n=1 Tax=Acinetobacter TaxID=469 RepID=UPI000235E6C4|nr:MULTISPECIES: TonB-dependent siderophore receptor [Acinetobacter]KXZ75492.1 Ferrichrome receptor FcuA precursor [Acinetobacter venetianus]GAB02913.1 putative TonB-dependent receptor-like protein [Acinetobacter sp. NBRC 100985]